MDKNQKQVMETLSEKEQRNLIGGLIPPSKDGNKSLKEQVFDEILNGFVCY